MKYCPQCKMGRKFEYIKLNIEEGMPAWKVAELAGVHENTIYNWLVAYQRRGFGALAEGNRAPKNHPNEYSDEIKGLIRKVRADGLKKENRHLGESLIAHRLQRDWGIKSFAFRCRHVHEERRNNPATQETPTKERAHEALSHS